jgi:sigma-B regulation protein RsbU (phosphoserine phosphatase)
MHQDLDSSSAATQGAAPPDLRRADHPLACCGAPRLAKLIEQIGQINSSLEPERLLASIMHSAAAILRTEASSLLLLDEASGELVLHLPTGPASAEITGRRIPAGQGICGWVAREGRGLFSNDPARDPRFFGELAGSFVTRNLTCVPVKRPDGRVIGVLQALNRRGETPFDREDLALLEALADQAAIALERDRLHRESLTHTRLVEQLALANEIQKGLWPVAGALDGTISVAGFSRPASQVGGDYYDFFRLADGRIGLALGDVCGKGPAAALLMSALRSTLRSHLEYDQSLDEIIARVNLSLLRDSPEGSFATLFAGIYDPRTRMLDFVNAGHNPPLLAEPSTGGLERLEIGGRELHPGQVLVLFSDGVTEALNLAEEEFGDHRLEALVLACRPADGPQALIDDVLDAVDAFVGAAAPFDDLTLLVLETASALPPA